MTPSTLSARAGAPLKGEPGLFDPTMPPEGSAAQSGSYVWGCDPSTLRVSIGVTWEGGVHAATKSFSRCKEGMRWRTFYAETLELAAGLVLDYPPASVWIERPGGAHIHPSSWQALGCVQAALCEATGLEVGVIPVSSWKSLACGHGGATKGQVMEWARRRGYGGRIEDESDALGIAVAGSLKA